MGGGRWEVGVTEHRVDLSGAVSAHMATLAADLGEAAAFGRIGTQVAALPPEAELPSPDTIIQFRGTESPSAHVIFDPSALNRVTSEYADYSTRYSHVAMIAALEEFLRNLLLVLRVGEAARKNGGKIRGDQYNQIRTQVRNKVRWKSVEGLLRVICRKVYPDSEGWPLANKPHLARLLSLNQLRHCLIHRKGRVETWDLDENGCMQIELIHVRLFCEDQEITSLPFEVRGQPITARTSTVAKVWKLGNRIELSAQDCQDIALTLILDAQCLATDAQKVVAEWLGKILPCSS